MPTVTFDDKIIALEANASTINSIVNGDVNTTVTTSSGQHIKSLAKFFHDQESIFSKQFRPLGTLSGIETLDVSEFQYYTGTLAGTTNFIFSGLPTTNTFIELTIHFNQDSVGGRVFSFPSSVKWDSGIAPNPSLAPGTDYLFSFISLDRGVCWLGFQVGSSFS